MIFRQLADPEYSAYIDKTDDGLVCIREETPENILKELEEINEEYKKILKIDFIKFK